MSERIVKGILGTKLGMTQLWDENNMVVPVTVIQAGPCVVTQVRTPETDGYNAVQLGFGAVKAKKVTKPLTGRRIGAYYGCMLLRPAGVMQFDDPENPSILEDFIKALGAEPVIYDYRNECCGGYLALSDKGEAKEMVSKVLSSAKGKGVTEMITACPLCSYNLEVNAHAQEHLPVHYFTELLAEALGVKEE